MWKGQLHKLEQDAGQVGLAADMDAGKNTLVFDVPLEEITVEFPWYYLSGGSQGWRSSIPP